MYMYTCMYLRMPTYMCIYIYILYIYMFTYIYIHLCGAMASYGWQSKFWLPSSAAWLYICPSPGPTQLVCTCQPCKGMHAFTSIGIHRHALKYIGSHTSIGMH